MRIRTIGLRLFCLAIGSERLDHYGDNFLFGGKLATCGSDVRSQDTDRYVNVLFFVPQKKDVQISMRRVRGTAVQ
jgi:hypothetical protein